MKERGAKVLKEKKKQKKKGQDDKKDKPKGLYTRESEAQLMLQAMAFNEKVIKLVHVVLYVILGHYFGKVWHLICYSDVTLTPPSKRGR